MSNATASFLLRDCSTFNRVKAVFRNDCFVPDPLFPDRLSAPFHSKGFADAREEGKYFIFTLEEQAARTKAFCAKLYDQVHDSTSHTARLDRTFSELLECSFQPSGTTSPFRHEESSELEDKITQRTLQLLNRLPAVPLELRGLPNGLPSTYFTPPTVKKGPHASSWEDLKIALHLSTNVIRVAICTAIHPWISRGKLSEFINHTAALLDTAAQQSSAAKTITAGYKWYLVRAFLWTSWQRTVMIYFSFLLAQHLESGFYDESSSSANLLRSTSPAPGISIQDMSKRYATLGKSHYMCSWAFELLRNDPVCIGMDFRRFHKHYSRIFDRYPARCTPNAKLSCKGDHPHSCKRFVGMVTKDQSAHDRGCTGCTSLFWDETSYRSTPGARAVSLEDTAGNKLRYREASDRTLTISHVWSHGQGGRPETGMNGCLHHRYRTIAMSMGCESYWMDTPCILTDHILRREAISNINKVFAESRATLVCDRDLMEIELVGDISVELRESILVTTMICDWNIRAWTFLEAFRGRESVYLLCKHNKVLSLKDTVEIVHREGSLDVGILLLTVPQLLPRVKMQHSPMDSRTGTITPLFRGFLTVEYSASLLSHRPASRPGDDIVIWSLLLEQKVYENAIDFWRGRQGQHIHTSFLVSTAPRLDIWRFGWAPSSPRIISDNSTISKPRSMGLNDSSSEIGMITADGLRANWLFCKLSRLKMTVSKLPLDNRVLPFANIGSIREVYLRNYKWGALLRPLLANQLDYVPAPNREDDSKTLVVVCGTNDPPNNDAAWEWKGVHEWDLKEPLPIFTYKRNILLV